jgi:hypothetical protein
MLGFFPSIFLRVTSPLGEVVEPDFFDVQPLPTQLMMLGSPCFPDQNLKIKNSS